MMWWARNLLSGFSFLRVHEQADFLQSKRVIEFVIPICLIAASGVAYAALSENIVSNVVGNLDDKLFQLIVFMVPFYLAALAALATFQSAILDGPMAGAAASFKKWSEEDHQFFYDPISMREYACRLFGYLCTLGRIYLVVSIAASLVNFSTMPMQISGPYSWVPLLILGLFFWHYIVMSLYAIYFLVSKTV